MARVPVGSIPQWRSDLRWLYAKCFKRRKTMQGLHSKWQRAAWQPFLHLSSVLPHFPPTWRKLGHACCSHHLPVATDAKNFQILQRFQLQIHFCFERKKARIRFPKPVFHSLSLAWIPIKTEFSPPPYKPPFIAVNNPSSRCLTDSSAKACNSCFAKKMISPLHWIFLRNK